MKMRIRKPFLLVAAVLLATALSGVVVLANTQPAAAPRAATTVESPDPGEQVEHEFPGTPKPGAQPHAAQQQQGQHEFNGEE